MFRRFLSKIRHVASVMIALGVCVLPSRSAAAIRAADNAGNAPYSDGWDGDPANSADNGGTGFQPWDFSGTFWDDNASPYDSSHFVETTASAFNDLGTPVWALTNANVPYGGHTSYAKRSFTDLQPGETISVDIDNPVMTWDPDRAFDNTGFIVNLLDSAGIERFGLFTFNEFNGDQWTVTDARGSSTGSGLTDVAGSAGFNFTFTLVSENTYKLTLSRPGSADIVIENSLRVDPEQGGGPITTINFVVYGEGSGNGFDEANGEREFYLNNLQIATASLICDLNGDGSADAADAGIIFSNWGLTGAGDCSGDGIVDAADAGILFSEWTGDSRPAQSVPEPVSLWWLLAVAGFTRWRSRV